MRFNGPIRGPRQIPADGPCPRSCRAAESSKSTDGGLLFLERIRAPGTDSVVYFGSAGTERGGIVEPGSRGIGTC